MRVLESETYSVVRSTSFGVKSELKGIKRAEFRGHQGKSILGQEELTPFIILSRGNQVRGVLSHVYLIVNFMYSEMHV